MAMLGYQGIRGQVIVLWESVCTAVSIASSELVYRYILEI